MAEKDRHETMALDLERQLSASKVTINQLIFELSEEQKVSQREKEAREKSEKRAEEVERQAKESRIALERALENLNDDYLDQKSMMRRKLDLLREEHKAAIYSFEMAFRTKLAEVCLQRDEYAEQVEMYREGKRWNGDIALSLVLFFWHPRTGKHVQSILSTTIRSMDASNTNM